MNATATELQRLPRIEDLQASADEMAGFVAQSQTATSWYLILLMFRFFMAYRAQPRLAVVTRTLGAVVVDIGHFLVVFLPTFFAYAIAGNIVFGRRMAEFSTLLSSFGQCFRILIENEYQWQRLSAEHYWTAAMWVWTFLLLVVLLMLNMVLAIVLDVYNQIRQDASSSESLVKSLGQLATRIAYARYWVSDREVEAQMKHHRSSSIRMEQFCHYFPEMPTQQSNTLFESCREAMKSKAGSAMESSEAMKLMASIKFSVDKINKGIASRVEAHQKGLPWPPPVDGRPSLIGSQLSSIFDDSDCVGDVFRPPTSPIYGTEASKADSESSKTQYQGSVVLSEDPKALAPGSSIALQLNPLETPFGGMACPPDGKMPKCAPDIPLAAVMAATIGPALDIAAAQGATAGYAPNPDRPEWCEEILKIVSLQNKWLLSLTSVMMQLKWHWQMSAKVEGAKPAAMPDPQTPPSETCQPK